MTGRTIVPIVLGVLILATSALAAPVAARDLAAENEELRGRVERLEQELESLKARLGGSDVVVAPEPEDADGVSSAVDAILAKYPGLALGESEEPAGIRIKPYGYIKLDMAYDSGAVSNGNYIRWVETGDRDDDDRTSITARQTRLGLDISGPVNGVDLSGKVEVDFYGTGAENKPEPFMRHAYLKVDWKSCGFSLIAGQTWDVVSPLNPSTLNYPVSWWAGNWGYRRPQLRATKVVDLEEDTKLTLALAATRNIGDGSPFSTTDAGADSAIPVFQARAAVTLPVLDAGGPATFGVWGHWGTEEYDTDADGGNEDFTTWSLGLDVTLPVCEVIEIKAEAYKGQDLDAYLGGIGQGVNLVTMDEIPAWGGWIGGAWKVDPEWTVNAGFSLEHVDKDDLSSGGRSRNRSLWANLVWSPLEHFKTGIEISHWATDYVDAKDGSDLRVQLSFIYGF